MQVLNAVNFLTNPIHLLYSWFLQLFFLFALRVVVKCYVGLHSDLYFEVVSSNEPLWNLCFSWVRLSTGVGNWELMPITKFLTFRVMKEFTARDFRLNRVFCLPFYAHFCISVFPVTGSEISLPHIPASRAYLGKYIHSFLGDSRRLQMENTSSWFLCTRSFIQISMFLNFPYNSCGLLASPLPAYKQ